MNRTALLTVPLLVALLAGCAGSGGDTAKSLRAVADGEAAAWDPDAFLVSAIGIEANINLTAEERAFIEKAAKEHADEQDAQDVLTLLSDPRVGDGVAPGWAFAYASSRGLYVVAVGADRRVVHSEAVNLTDLPAGERDEFQSELEQMRPIIEEGIAAWSVDSAQAANALAAANSTFAQQVGKPDQIATWALNPVDRTWQMFLMPAKGQGVRMMASISYENASVLSVKVFGMPKVQVPTETPVVQPAPAAQSVKQEAGQVSGSVSLLSSTDSGSFQIKNEHDGGTLVFEADEQLVGSSTITVTVTSPSGSEYEASLGAMFGSDETSMDFVPEEGEWQVEMMAGGVTSGTDVTVSWCTDGEPTQGTAGNPACGGYLVIAVGPPEAAPQRTGPFSRWMPF